METTGEEQQFQDSTTAAAAISICTDSNCPRKIKRRDLFQFMRHIMQFGAMYPLPLVYYFPKCLRPVAVFIDLAHEFFLYFVVLHVAILYICTIYFNLNGGDADLEFVANCLVQTIIYCWGMIMKLYFRRIQPKQLEDIMNYINSKHRIRSANGFTYVPMDEAIARSDKWAKSFVYSAVFAVIFWLCLPLIYRDRSLPLPCWYPVDYKAPIIYETIYFLQIIGQLQVAIAFTASTTSFMIISIMLSGQYDILNCSLKNIMARTYMNAGASKIELIDLCEQQKIENAEVNQYYCAKEKAIALNCIPHLLLNANASQRLQQIPAQERNLYITFKIAFKDCVDHHRYILKALRKLEEFFYVILFFKTGQATFLLCLVAFISVKSTAANSLMRMLSLGQYLVLLALDMLIICYSGEIIVLNSQRCGEAILRSPWYLHICEMKRDFLFFILNSQRSFQLTAGKLLNLNLERFKNIVTMSFSFLTLLQKMDLRN